MKNLFFIGLVAILVALPQGEKNKTSEKILIFFSIIFNNKRW